MESLIIGQLGVSGFWRFVNSTRVASAEFEGQSCFHPNLQFSWNTQVRSCVWGSRVRIHPSQKKKGHTRESPLFLIKGPFESRKPALAPGEELPGELNLIGLCCRLFFQGPPRLAL